MRLIEELEGDVIDGPLVDIREAVGPGMEPVILGMIVIRRVRMLVLYRHPRSCVQPQPSTTFDHHWHARQTYPTAKRVADSREFLRCVNNTRNRARLYIVQRRAIKVYPDETA